MSGWDIEDNDDDSPQPGTAGHVGSEFYTIVVHYKGAKLKHMLPHHYKEDANGNPIKSIYKSTQNMTEISSQEDVVEKRTVKWATTNDMLQSMSTESKGACNAIKSFLSKNKVLLWYHQGDEDDCAKFGKNHWHIIIKNELGANGHWKYLHDVSVFRTLRLKVQAAAGYAKAQKVRYLNGLIMHLNCAPRIFMGCNHKELMVLWREAKSCGAIPGRIDELVEDDPSTEDVDVRAEKRYNSWDDDDTGPVAKKKSSWDSDEEPFVLPAASKAAVVVKETANDSACRLLRVLMVRYQANNKSEMFKAISTIPAAVDEKYKRLWYRLATKASTAKNMETSLDYLKCENMSKSFEQLVHEYCTSVPMLDAAKYEPVDESYKYFIQWCKNQNITPGVLITNTIDVMNKVHNKINTICMTGASNSGKTVMYANPLKAIMRYVGSIGNRGNESPFIWQDCINTSLICIDECIMNPAHYEDLKAIMGGEPLKAQVKHQGMGTVQRTPVILTGNSEPWVLNYDARDAMINRMYQFEVKEDCDLKEVKYLHPGMWWYLKQQYGQEEKLKLFKKLTPYPAQVDDVPIDDCDPLD